MEQVITPPSRRHGGFFVPGRNGWAIYGEGLRESVTSVMADFFGCNWLILKGLQGYKKV